MTTPTTNYVPGVCNINKKEITYRKKAGYFGLGLAAVMAAALLGFGLNRYLRVVLIVPVFIAAIGYLQTKNKFCVAYGASGRQNADEDSSQASNVSDSHAATTDKKKAQKMNLQAAVAAVIITALAVLV